MKSASWFGGQIVRRRSRFYMLRLTQQWPIKSGKDISRDSFHRGFSHFTLLEPVVTPGVNLHTDSIGRGFPWRPFAGDADGGVMAKLGFKGQCRLSTETTADVPKRKRKALRRRPCADGLLRDLFRLAKLLPFFLNPKPRMRQQICSSGGQARNKSPLVRRSIRASGCGEGIAEFCKV